MSRLICRELYQLVIACFTHKDENSFAEIASALNDRIFYNIRAPRFFLKPKKDENEETSIDEDKNHKQGKFSVIILSINEKL